MKKGLLTIFILLNITMLYGWEVTTHQKVTREAISGDNKAENLKYYLRQFKLSNKNYSKEGDVTLTWNTTETGSYVDVAEKLAGGADLGTTISLGNTYQGVIEAGSILEDTIQRTTGINYSHARYLRHFYDPHESGCYGLHGWGFHATCAKIWALKGDADPDMNYDITEDNDFSWVKARDYHLNSIIGETEDNRTLAQASLFVSMGFISHLVEDMTQSAHVRNDSHGGTGAGGINAFEVWADKNYNINKSNISKSFSIQADVNPTSFDALFKNTATFTHDNFFSDDTFPWQIDNGNHTSPAKANAIDDATPYKTDTNWRNKYYYYIRANDLDIPNGTLLGIHKDLNWGRDDWLLTDGSKTYLVLEDQAKIIFPKAIKAVEGMINFFFRARIEAYIDENNRDKLIIKNTTSQNTINPNANMDITNADIHILYETVDGSRLKLKDKVTGKSLKNNTEISIEGLKDAIDAVSDTSLPDNKKIGKEKIIIVAVDGLMGSNKDEDRVVAGFSFAYQTYNASLLISFDKSGSMGSQIEDAKSSALNILPILQNDMNNSYVEIDAFSSSATVLQSFTNDFDAVKNTINNIYSGGMTSLYDAIVLASNRAISEKNTHPDNKVIIVLYTDGKENDSSHSLQNAIDAIKNKSELKEVYLVFINTGDLSGKQKLKDLADSAGRKFIYLSSPKQLASEIVSILK